MARYIYQSQVKDGEGRIISGATVSVFLAGTSTAANVYTSKTSTTQVDSVTTDTHGYFSFYFDDFDYDSVQTFDLTVSASGYVDQSYTSVKPEIVPGTYTISTAKTCATVIHVPKGVTYTKSGSGTIAFTGTFTAGMYQIFSGFVSGDITFSAGSVDRVVPQWWGGGRAGTTDDATALNAALGTLRTVYAPADTYTTTSATVLVYPDQEFYGDGENRTIITSALNGTAGWENYLPVVATCDSSGRYAYTTKDFDKNTKIHGMTVYNTGDYSIGVLYAGKEHGGVGNITISHTTSPYISAGSRSGIGLLLTGLDNADGEGCHFSAHDSVSIYHQECGLYHGARVHANSPIANLLILYCVDAIVEDDGTMLSFSNLKVPATLVLDHPVLEGCTNNGIRNIIADRVTILGGYNDGLTADVFEMGAGGVLSLTNPYFSSLGANRYDQSAGGTIMIQGYAPSRNTDGGGAVTGFRLDPISYSRNQLDSLQVGAAYKIDGTVINSNFPTLLTGTISMTGAGTSPSLNANVTFANFTGLPSTVTCVGAWTSVVQTTSGGDENAKYSTSIQGLAEGNDTVFNVRVYYIPGTNVPGTETIVVRWWVLAYVP